MEKVSHWLVKKKKDPDELPLVVNKVVRKYTRKKIEQPAVNKLTEVNSTKSLNEGFSEQICKEIKLDNHVHIKEENLYENTVISEIDNREGEQDPHGLLRRQICTEIKLENDVEENLSENTVTSEIDNREDEQDGLLQNKAMVGNTAIRKEGMDPDEDDTLLLIKKDGVASITFDLKNGVDDCNIKPTNDAEVTEGGSTDMSTTQSVKGEDDTELIQVQKCYLVAVNVQPAEISKYTSNRRKYTQRRGIALLQAKNECTPENPPPFKMVAKSVIFSCELCDKTFLIKNELRTHIRNVHGVLRAHVCAHCRAAFTHRYLLLAHLRRHTGKPLACDLCPKRFKQENSYASHLNTHLRERLFACPVCLTRYTDFQILQNHALKHSADEVFACDSCGRKNSSLLELQRHRERVHGEKSPYPCYVCPRLLASEREFYDHLDSHTNALYECAFCPKRFTDAGRWERHSAGHIDETKKVTHVYTCDVCQKRFMFASMLKTHVKHHADARPYSCGICSKTFKTRSHWKEHQNNHERPFACSVCEKRFGKRGTRDRHYRIHTGECSYICSVCDVAFKHRYLLLHHNRKLHTPGENTKKKKAKKCAKAKSKENST